MKDAHKTKDQLIQELQELRYQLALDSDEQRQELTDIHSLLVAINTTLNLDEVIEKVMDALRHVFNFNQISIYLFNAETSSLEVTNWYGEGVTEELRKIFENYPLSIDWDEVYFVRSFLDSEIKVINSVTPELLVHYSDRDRQMFEWNPHKGIAIFPLEVQEKVIGVINFVHTEAPFSLRRQDVYRIGRYVAAIATTINNAYLVRKTRYALEQSRAREREIAHLNQVILTTATTLDLDEVFAAISLGLKDIFEFEAVGIQLADKEKNLLNIHKVYGDVITEELLEKWCALEITTVREDSASSYTFATGETFYFPKITPELPFTDIDRVMYEIKPFSAYMALPLIVQHETIGVISFFRADEYFNLDEEDLARIRRYVASLSTAINNARIHEQLKRSNTSTE
ncbi:GAF domain-containing protein [Allohahella marinimesophila]|uniref:GAF domain-containing protein n=1 Tax=Allohahella marinimesophila TaxID=1054972 RepID=A0ABP7NG97_9GAMM